MKPNNPFFTVGYCGPEYFCDRKRETKKLLSAIAEDSNVTLIAPRRYGKTGLIHHVFNSLDESSTPIYFDIYATRNLADFTKVFVEAITGAGETTIEKATKAVAQFFKSCRSTMTPQESGLPKFSFDIVPLQAELTLKEAFEYLKSRNKRMVIAIDEFQQILEYPEKGAEALLRSYIQEVPWVRFIFAGSRHHIMGEMFLTPKHPFYNSTDILSLRTIDRQEYANFAEGFFKADGKIFSHDAFEYLYEKFSGITWYIQRVLKGVWSSGQGLRNPEDVDAVINELIADRETTFADLYSSQNEVSRNLLLAIACEEGVLEPTAASFLKKYSLCASSVRSALAALVDHDLVYKAENGYIIYERLFGFWLKQISANYVEEK